MAMLLPSMLWVYRAGVHKTNSLLALTLNGLLL